MRRNWHYTRSFPTRANGLEVIEKPSILPNKAVRGQIITTSSKWDKAVGVFYPIASRMKGSPAFAAGLLEYGAIGAFGIQGLPYWFALPSSRSRHRRP
jgi:hypothetical protein